MNYTATPLTSEEVAALPGRTLLEFGADFCGHCQGAQPIIASALAGVPPLRHFKIEDGKGRPLGRSFKVKLWPTLIVLDNGQETGRVTRPKDPQELRALLQN